MKSALARLGVRGFKPHLRKAPERLAGLRTAEGTGLPVNIIEEFRRDMARLALVREQISSILNSALRRSTSQQVLCWVLCFQIGDDMAKRNSKRREWTKTDVRELKTLAREKTPARKIARTLKRTEGATRQKAFSLGVSLDSRM